MKAESEILGNVYFIIVVFVVLTVLILSLVVGVFLAQSLIEEVQEIEKKGIKNIILPIWEGKEEK